MAEEWINCNTDNKFINNISPLFQKDFNRNKDKISFLNPLSVFWFIHISTFFTSHWIYQIYLFSTFHNICIYIYVCVNLLSIFVYIIWPYIYLFIFLYETCLLFSFDTKLICYHLLFMVANKRKIECENKSSTLDRQRETNCHEKRESRHRPWYYLSYFLL